MSARPPWVLGARSETGFVRKANEDRMGWQRARFGEIFVVCDGMGGPGGGDVAAQIAIDELQRRLAAIPPTTPRFTDHVREAFSAANKAVHERRRPDDAATRAMGTTGLALITDGRRFIVAHVGDSRAYLWRGGRLQQLTRDHTHVQDMVDDGLLTPDQASSHPDASVLVRAIGHQPTVQADVTDWIPLEAGDALLLCSDGLSGYVTNAEIAAILSASPEPQAATDALIKAALDSGGHDNVTVQIVRFTPSIFRAIRAFFARAVVLVPACVALTVAGGWIVERQRAASDRGRIETLTAALAQANLRLASALRSRAVSGAASQATTAASEPSLANAQPPAGSARKPAAATAQPAPASPATRVAHGKPKGTGKGAPIRAEERVSRPAKGDDRPAPGAAASATAAAAATAPGPAGSEPRDAAEPGNATKAPERAPPMPPSSTAALLPIAVAHPPWGCGPRASDIPSQFIEPVPSACRDRASRAFIAEIDRHDR